MRPLHRFRAVRIFGLRPGRPVLTASVALGAVLAATAPAASAQRTRARSAPRPRTAVSSPDSAATAAVLARVREEGLERSRVLETATILSDGFGPRLAGSAGFQAAAEWARSTLASYGLTARLEPWGTPYPYAWSPATAGTGDVVRGTPVWLDSVPRTVADVERVAERVRDRIVLVGPVPRERARLRPFGTRWSDAQLDSLARLTAPGSPKDYWEDVDGYTDGVRKRQAVFLALRRAGAVAVLTPSANPVAVVVSAYQAYDTDLHDAVPAMAVSRDDYARLTTLVRLATTAGRPAPELALQIRARLDAPRTRADSTGANVIAELPGSDPTLGAEVVMVGGHFDSWPAGTGATDNAAGAAVAIEAMRLLTAAGAHPRRTLRLALWDGEEHEDYFGSLGWVRAHLGDPETLTLKPEHARLSAYLNFDNGTGKVRGVWLQGNAAARAVFHRVLAPVADLGPTTLTIANTGSTDHIPFTGVGIPAFTFLQDPLDYEQRTHHSNADVAANLSADDLRQAAIVTATALYGLANEPQRVPRLPLPAPRPVTSAAAAPNATGAP